MDRKFLLDMAAAHKLSTTKQNQAHAAAYLAAADRLFPVVVPPPVDPPPVTPPPVSTTRPFAASSPWNTPIPPTTLWYDHACLRRHWYVNELSMRIWHASASDPLGTFDMPRFVDPTFNRNRPAEKFTFRLPAAATVGTDEDHIFFVVDDTTGDYVEVWQAVRNGNTITAPGGGWARGNMRTGTGVGTAWPTGNNAGVRAANFSWGAGLLTGADIAANNIDHALVLSAGFEVLSNTLWRAPATAPDNGGHGGPLAMGTRLGIPPGTPAPAGLSPLGAAMFAALRIYGAYIGDFAGGESFLSFYADHGTVAQNDPKVLRLFVWWESYTADMDLIGPLVRVADYQPGA